jgi:hypothetical protein
VEFTGLVKRIVRFYKSYKIANCPAANKKKPLSGRTSLRLFPVSAAFENKPPFSIVRICGTADRQESAAVDGGNRHADERHTIY